MRTVERCAILLLLAISPVQAAWFRGSTHAHTNQSDGQDLPETVARWYRDHGYQFVFITDHNTVTDVAPLNAKLANAGRFLVLPGEEVSSDLDRWRIHVNSLSVHQKAVPQTGGSAVEVLQRTITAALEAGGIAQINHPNLYWSLTADDIAATKGAKLLEIFTGSREANTSGAGQDAPGAEEIWDRVLSKGMMLFASAGDDTHIINNPAVDSDLPGRGWIMVRADRLGAADILAAIEKGDFYASTGIEISDYSVGGEQILVSVAPKPQVRYVIEFIGHDGKVLQSTGGTAATYRIAGSEGYVRARVTDSSNHRAWMQPVMPGHAELKTETPPAAIAVAQVQSPAAPPIPPSRASTPQGPARVWEGNLRLTTWDEGSADPNPQFQVLNVPRPWYPYPLRSSFGKQNHQQTYRTLNLENEYLACVVMPELGGRLYSCRDKLSGQEMFHANSSIKKAMIGLRGAWAAAGVELNFPVGHSLLTTSPVDSGTTHTADSASVWVGATDRLTGMRWRVEFTLERGVAALRQRVYLENATTVSHHYYWWSNASVAMHDDMRFVVPTQLIATHGTTRIDPWPVNNAGQDRSLPSSYANSIGLFAHESKEPFLAVYEPSTHSGTLHWADPMEMPGKKIWTWGHDSAAEMRSSLSDDNSLYVEIQAGVFANQETYGMLEPGAQRTFTEYWIPVRAMDGISQASPNAVLNLGRSGGVLTAQFQANRALNNARLQVMKGTAVLLDQKVSLKPDSPLVRSIPDAGVEKITVRLSDSTGKELLAYTEGEIRAAGAESVRLGPQPQVDWSALTFDRATYNDLQGNLFFSANDYHKLLDRAPNDLRALKGAGRMDVTLNRFEEAQTHLADAVKLAPQDGEAHYYLGLALAGRGSDADARREWAQARGDATFGQMAALEDAAAIARSGDLTAAIAAIRAARSRLTIAVVAEAALARNLSEPQTPEIVARARALDPTNSAARVEEALAGMDAGDLWDHLAADSSRVLAIADLYLHWGLYRDAEALLTRSYPSVPPEALEPGAVPPANDPLVAYYAGYCRERQKQEGTDYFRGGSQRPVAYVFPSLPSSRAVLESAIRASADDANAHYLLGLWLLHSGLTAEAGRELQAGQKLQPTLREARVLLASMKLPVASEPRTPARTPKTDPEKLPARKPAAPVAPLAPPSSPAEIAMAALVTLADGDLGRARGYFTATNFPAEKQEDAVREAYIELELQRLLSLAAEKKCKEVESLLANIGAYDKNLPFTFQPFNSLMKGARFQYYLADAESVCDEKEARKMWEKVSKMKPEMASTDFVYPILAATQLSAPSRASAALDAVQRALQTTSGPLRGVLAYHHGLLLELAGRRRDAIDAFHAGEKASPPGMTRYLNTLALRVAQQQ
jgi:Flp pilus assembly protein TadD/histidinol phosphatase-like PHP family hydrolase